MTLGEATDEIAALLEIAERLAMLGSAKDAPRDVLTPARRNILLTASAIVVDVAAVATKELEQFRGRVHEEAARKAKGRALLRLVPGGKP